MRSPRPWQAALAVGIVAVAVQVPAIRSVLLWDDVLFLRRSDLYTQAARWTESLTAPVGRISFYWRPVATSSFLADTLVYGGAAWGHRLTGALLHATTSVLAFVLVLRLLGSVRGALVAALIFALHPVHVETVTWISARFDLCAGLFSLAALAALPRDVLDRSRGRLLLAAVLTVAACCSKENAYVLVFVTPLWLATSGCQRLRDTLVPALWIAGGVAAALFMRTEAVGFVMRTRSEAMEGAGGALEHMLLFGRAFATSIETLVFPWGTVGPAHHGVRPIPLGDVRGWVGVGLAVILVVLTLVALSRRRREGLLLAAFLVSLAPTLQIVPLDLAGGLHSADRFLYLPSFFAIAAIATVIRDRAPWNDRATRAAGLIAVALLIALAAGRLAILPRWNDPVRFWTWAAESAPASDIVQTNLAMVQYQAGRAEVAETHARLAGPLGLRMLAKALQRQGRYHEALRALEQVSAGGDDDSDLRIQRGEVLLAMARPEAALVEFEAAIVLHTTGPSPLGPVVPRAHAGAATALSRLTGRNAAARERATRADAEASSHLDPDTWVAVAGAWLALNESAKALAAVDRAESAGALWADVGELRAKIGK